jgi:signal transduction histidine kinase
MAATCPVLISGKCPYQATGVCPMRHAELGCPAGLRLQAWTAATPDLICLIDREGYYRDVVPGIEVPPIMPITELIGAHASKVGDPELGRLTIEKARFAMDTREVVEWQYRHPERPAVQYEARFAASGPDECLIVIRDITVGHDYRHALEKAVKRRTAELQRSNDELRQFAYAASHDLREPLGKIKAFGARLEDRYGDVLDGRGVEYLNVMTGAADRMMGLIDDLLELSRVGRANREFKDVPLEPLIQEVALMFSEQMEDSVLVLDPPFPTVFGDRHQIFTLFQNLISNSLKFKKPGTPAHIEVRTEERDKYSVITVRDNGIGFDPKFATKVFQIFERLHSRFDYPGTGIGLALCRRIVERHGGFIEAEGVPNEGALFRIGFPKETPHAS